ncbi:hypothetical protein EW026_g8467, partial [Hermanssonia centrifuga]
RNKVSLYDAHIQNGHVSYEYIKKVLNADHKYLGLQIDPSKMEEPLCKACVKGKISRAPIRKERISNRAVNFGDILHMDLWGPSPVCAPGGLQYTFTILDEATGWLHEPKMRTKDEAFGRFVAWHLQCFTQNANSINYNLKKKKSPSAKVRALTDGTGITGEEFDHANNFLSANIVYVTSQVGNDPANMREALARPDSQQWMLAMVEEITRLEARNSWEYVYPPTNANLISARFVYNLKGDEHGNPTRYRARLVAQGYKQVEGLDYNFDDIFAPVARLESVRAMCAIAAIKDDELVQTDIKSTFLYGRMEPGEDVYLVPPKGITLPGLKPGQPEDNGTRSYVTH